MVKSVCELGDIECKTIKITFDDSVIEDKEAAARQALIEYNAGLIDEVEYFIRARNMDKETAIRYATEISERKGNIVEDEPDEE